MRGTTGDGSTGRAARGSLNTIDRVRIMVASITLTWSEGVSELEADVLVRAVNQTLNWLYFRRSDVFFDPPLRVHVFGNWVIPSLVDQHPYWGTQWYIDSSYDGEADRIVAPSFLELVRNEPWQKTNPHLDLALLDEDLTDMPAPLARRRRDYYSLGTSYPERAAVMSVFRLRGLESNEVKTAALWRLVRHHLGHLLAIPPFGTLEHVSRRGLETHCNNRCVMRHAETVQQLVALALEEAPDAWSFCPRCTAALHSAIVLRAGNWN
jgi:hypothetical protein